jgi:hypothetical protein
MGLRLPPLDGQSPARAGGTLDRTRLQAHCIGGRDSIRVLPRSHEELHNDVVRFLAILQINSREKLSNAGIEVDS